VLGLAFFVVALDASPEGAVPDIHGHAHAWGHAVAFAEGAFVAIGRGAVGGLEDLRRVPGAAQWVAAEVEDVDLAVDERAVAVLPEAVVPDAPVDHVHLVCRFAGEGALEVADDLGGSIVGDVDDHRARRLEGAGAQVDPVVGEGEVVLPGHVVFPLVVVAVPVKGWIGEDEIDLALLHLRERGED